MCKHINLFTFKGLKIIIHYWHVCMYVLVHTCKCGGGEEENSIKELKNTIECIRLIMSLILPQAFFHGNSCKCWQQNMWVHIDSKNMSGWWMVEYITLSALSRKFLRGFWIWVYKGWTFLFGKQEYSSYKTYLIRA